MPGVLSLEKRQYYANPLNKFWTMLPAIFESSQPLTGYADKIAFLKSKNIALWDVIKECQRSGSSDSKIINPVVNDLADLLARYPGITGVFFNGRKAEQLFRRYVRNIPNPGITLKLLPSTSPAYAGLSLERKMQEWRVIREMIE